MYIIIALYMGLITANKHSEADYILRNISSCQHALVLCATGNCKPNRVTKLCPVDALRPRELMILQTELRSATNKFNGLPEGINTLCVEEFERYYAMSLKKLKQDGNVLYLNLGDLQEAFHGPDLETFYRAGLESNLTGITTKAAYIDGVRDSKFIKCPISPIIPDMLLRAQNLAFAREHDFIGRMKKGEVDQRLLRSYFHTFLHADLWQQAQVEALEVFESLLQPGQSSTGAISNLRGRVAAHVPLYDDDKLAREWPR